MATLDAAALAALVTQLQIAHHIPGRIRLKLDGALAGAGQEAIAEATRLFKNLDRTPGIRSASLNLLARSCTIEYDAKAIPPSAWGDLVAGVAGPEAQALLQLLVDQHRALAA